MRKEEDRGEGGGEGTKTDQEPKEQIFVVAWSSQSVSMDGRVVVG